MKNKYKFGFDFTGLVLFFLIMVPNFIWFAVPAPNDVLRQESVTPVVDIIASIFQVIMVVAMVFLKNTETKGIKFDWSFLTSVFCLLFYCGCWIVYYTGRINGLLCIFMCVVPCMSFGFLIVNRKNWLSLIPLSVFTVCHLIFGIVNFC